MPPRSRAPTTVGDPREEGRPPVEGSLPATAGPGAPGARRVDRQPDGPRTPRVRPPGDATAVLVAHDGARWLPEVLQALAALTVAPRRLIAVDTGSADDSPALLAAATGGVVDRVLTLPRTSGFGEAVAAALEVEADAAGGPATWVWLLHDDAAPAPDCLQRLLEHAATSPSAALLGPKALDWAEPRLLVEVGVTTDSAGHRETGLERREVDQGQHDAVRDVLAVGTAAALVRRDAYDAVGGLDPALPVFRDDLDLGWRLNAAGHRVVVVPSARLRHARAATTGTRSIDATDGRPEAVDRRAALTVLLAHAPSGRLPLLVLRLVLATVLRVLAFLLTRQLLAARDEVASAVRVAAHPGRLRAARRSRAASRTVPARDVRALLASRGSRARARAAALGDWVSSGGRIGDRLAGLGGDAPETDRSGPGGGLLRRALVRPGVVLVLVLLLLALVAERELLSFRDGALTGGRLLPPPDGAGALWESYAAAWHPTSVGSDAPGSAAVAALALLSTVLLGKAWLAVDVLLLASVPLAAAAAYAAAGAVVRHTALRLWAAATWAVLPVATGAVAAGRLDAAAVQVALPLLALSAGRLLTTDPRHDGWRRPFALGLGLTLTAALSPVVWVLAALALAGGTVVRLLQAGRGQRAAARRAARAALLAVAVPVVLLLPAWTGLLETPGLLLHGPGRLAADGLAADAALGAPPEAWRFPLLHPGGHGLPHVAVTAALLIAALVGLLRRERRRLARSGWALALLGVAAAVLLSRTAATVPASGERLLVWPGAGLQVAGVGLLLAALVAADGARSRLADRDFGLRQLLAGLLVGAAVLGPVVAAIDWAAGGAGGPLRRGAEPVLPLFARAELAERPGLRVLVLRPGPGGVAYDLADGAGSRLGSTETPPDERQVRLLDAVVADLLTPSGSDAAAALATRAVRYVALPVELAGTLPAVLDAQDGLVRRSGSDVLLWEVAGPSERLVVLPPGSAGSARAGARGPTAGQQVQPLLGRRLPAGTDGRLLVLAEATDDTWTATLDGVALRRTTAWGWATAFELPAAAGELQVRPQQRDRRIVLVLQAAALLAVLVLAAPGPRPRQGLEPAAGPSRAAGPPGPAGPTAPPPTAPPPMASGRSAPTRHGAGGGRHGAVRSPEVAP